MMPRWQKSEHPRSRRFALALLLVSAAALQTACGPKASNAYVIASVSDVSSLDPHLLDSNHPTGSVIWSLFDSLVRRGPDGADLPRLATSWERIDDLTWRFHLRRGVKFQDGSPFTAADVKFSFDRMNKPPFSSVQQLWAQTTLKEVRVVDDGTVDLLRPSGRASPCSTGWRKRSSHRRGTTHRTMKRT